METKNNKEIIKLTCTVERVRFYKDQFGIIVCSIDRIKEGTPHLDKDGTLIFKGVMPQPIIGNAYNITAEYVEDPKWGKQYNILCMFSAIVFGEKDKKGQRKFLESIFTPLQVENMYEALDDPFLTLKEENVADLVKVRGCGLDTAVRWVHKFNANFYMGKIYTELEHFNLTNNMIKKLIERYRSPDLVIEKVKNNPYVLCNEVKGIGWKTADKIALDGGLELYSPLRIGAYIIYYLDNCGDNGNSWITPDELMGAILEEMGDDVPDPNISQAIQDLGNKLWWNSEKTKIGLKKYYDIEHKIAEELIRLRDAKSSIKYDKWEDTIKYVEFRQGWEFTEEQKLGIATGLKNNVTVITGAGGCVDCDTEYFNGFEWKKISEYQIGDKVLQYNEDGTAELVIPSRYIKKPSKKLYHFETKYGLDQCLSLDHNVVYRSCKGKMYNEPFEKIMKKQQTSGFHGRFLTTFNYEGKGINLTDNEIRLKVAIFADGTFFYDDVTNTKCRVHLKKDRKKQRLEKLLKLNNIIYDKRNSSAQGFNDYYFYTDSQDKHFPIEWYQCSKHQLKIIADEIGYWDSRYSTKNEYTTTCKKDADFIQFVFTSLGYRATIGIYNRVGQDYLTCNKIYQRKSVEYTVRYTTRTLVGLCTDRREHCIMTPITEYVPKDGYQYCFTVPSHMLVLRRNDKIFITGNCGKSSVVAGILEVLKNYSFAQAALSGRAASRLSEITETEGYTIHRLLGFPKGEKNGFTYHEDNPLSQDIIIIDEISMIDGFLFYNLLRAIKSGAKVFLLGDPAQLESIGCASVAFDMICSNEIPTITLTQIHRQAAKSAIITESIKVRNGTQLVEKDWVGTETRGELQDLTFNCYSDASNTYYEIMKTFAIDMATENFHILNTQIIAPIKSRGNACTYEINNAIQELYNPEDTKKKNTTIYSQGKPYILREGDKVINVVNNYKTEPPIYNGNIGIIQKFDVNEDGDEIMIVDFVGIGEVVLLKEFWSNIELAYAITTHKSQGSEFPHVIFGFDFSSYSLLSREMVYTGITRAKKKCTLIAQTGALRMAVSKAGVNIKQTHLQQCLYNVAHPKLIF